MVNTRKMIDEFLIDAHGAKLGACVRSSSREKCGRRWTGSSGLYLGTPETLTFFRPLIHIYASCPPLSTIISHLCTMAIGLIEFLRPPAFKCYEYRKPSLVRCTKCDRDVNISARHEKQCLKDHIATERHSKNQAARQPTIDTISARNNFDETDEFNRTLTLKLAEAGIPLEKLNHPSIKHLFETVLRKRVYSRRHLSNKYLAFPPSNLYMRMPMKSSR